MVVKEQKKGGSAKPATKSSNEKVLYHTYPSSGSGKYSSSEKAKK